MSVVELTEILRALRVGWRNLAIGGGAGLLAFGMYALLSPKWYEAQLAVVPGTPPKAQSALAGAISMELPVDIGVGGTDAERIQAVMKSRSVTDAVIEKFGLMQRYHEKYIEGARKSLWAHCSTKIDKKPNVVTVTCEDKDPNVAQAMTAYFGVVGNRVMRHVSASSAGEERRFLEERVAEAKKDANEASERVRDFEEKHKIIDLPEQSKAVVSAIATLKGDLLSKQLQLDYLHGFSSSDEATAVQLRRQVGVMQSKMRMLEDEPGDDGATVAATAPTAAKRAAKGKQEQDIFPVAMTVPKLRFELGELYREQKVQETLLLLLTQRYEMARVDEARDTSVFQILDEPVVPTHHSRPKRAQLVVLGLVLGLLAGAGYTLRGLLLPSAEPPQNS